MQIHLDSSLSLSIVQISKHNIRITFTNFYKFDFNFFYKNIFNISKVQYLYNYNKKNEVLFDKIDKNILKKKKYIGSNLLNWSEYIKVFKKYKLLNSSFNIVQFLRLRYGINNILIHFFLKYTGIHFCYKMYLLRKNVVTRSFKFVMDSCLHLLDNELNLSMHDRLLFYSNCSLPLTKSVRFKFGLPIKGQRTKSNGCTSKKRVYKYFGETKKLWIEIFDSNKKRNVSIKKLKLKKNILKKKGISKLKKKNNIFLCYLEEALQQFLFFLNI